MTGVFRLRITWIWILLVVATCFSWEAMWGVEWMKDPRAGTIIVMSIAFLKTRFIMLDFMDLRHAPTPLRIFVDVWVFGVFAVVIGLYWTGAPF